MSKQTYFFRASPPATADVLFENVPTSPQTTFENTEAPSPLVVNGGGARQSREEHSKLLQDQRQTIDLLVSEKAALTEGLERLEGVEASKIIILIHDGSNI